MTMLAMWVVFDRPRDYPDGAVARRFEIDRGGPFATETVIMAPSIGALRALLGEVAPTAIVVPRDPSDEPQIVEVWL